MAYTTPNTSWVAGDPVLASDMNRIEGNIVALKDPPASEYDPVSAYTTTSTSFVDVDATNLALTITTTGGDVIVGFYGALSESGASYYGLDVDVDGTREGNADGLIGMRNPTSAAPGEPISFTRIVTGLSAGSHTFKLQWKTSAGTLTLYSDPSGSASERYQPQFWVREI